MTNKCVLVSGSCANVEQVGQQLPTRRKNYMMQTMFWLKLFFSIFFQLFGLVLFGFTYL
jgi:hypothetical protein